MELVAGPARGGPMKIEKIRLTPPPGWRGDPPRQWFSQPYPWREAAWWVAKTLFGPARAHAGLVPRLDQNVCTEAITTRMTVGFLGDIMPLGAREFVVDDSVKAFFAGVDLLVGNLEGTVIDGRAPSRFMGQAHTRATIDLLADLFPPERTLLTCANNHAGEYGWDLSAESQQMLEARGFRVVGRADEPAALVDGRVLIAVGTDWTNRRCGYAARLETLERLAEVDAALRIACPHWGYELEANPRPLQVAHAGRLLRQWDAIVGHHSHWPQPVTLYHTTGGPRLVAYSLGNFTFGVNFSKHLQGAILRLELGPRADGRWSVARVAWRATRIRFPGRRYGVVETCRREYH